MTARMLTFAALIVGATAGFAAAQDGVPAPPVLETVQDAMERRFEPIPQKLAEVAEFAGANGTDSAATAAYAKSRLSADGVTLFFVGPDHAAIPVPLNDLMVEAGDATPMGMPEGYEAPVHVSQAQRAPDGDMVVDVARMMDPQDPSKGQIILRISIANTFAAELQSRLQGTPIDCWMMETDGTLVYDADAREIGRDLFTDPLYAPYPELRELGKRLAAEAVGTGTYQFYDTNFREVAKKRASWTTVHLANMEWRVVVVQLVFGEDGNLLTATDDLGVMESSLALRKLTDSPAWLDAFAAHDEAYVRGAFHHYLEDNPHVYSVATINAAGVVRFGEPSENSFEDYPLTENRRPEDQVLLAAARADSRSWLIFELMEGGRGLYFVRPLLEGETPLGAVYVVWRLPEETP